MVATAQNLSNDLKSKRRAFYGFFEIDNLDKLSLDEATNLLTKIAQLQKDSELNKFIRSQTGRDRIKAIHHLAGGNHRVYIIFSQFLTRDSLDDLVKPVMQTLDELTPYYQARMQWLSPQQRKIVELLCDRRHAVPVKEIAQRCFISHQTASSQLKDLLNKGYVVKETQGRESFYELLEPLMRICLETKKQRGKPIKLFIDFLRIWYTKQELGKNKDAIDSYEKSIQIESGSYYVWFSRGCALNASNRNEEAIQSFEKAIEIDPDNYKAWVALAGTQTWIGRNEEAVQYFDRALEINSNINFSWCMYGIALFNTERYQKAIQSFEKEIVNNPNDNFSWFYLGTALLATNNWKEAISTLENGFKLVNSNREFYGGDTKAIVFIIFENKQNRDIWNQRIEEIVILYGRYDAVFTLGKGITENIPNLLSEMVSNKAARTWLEVWQQVAGDKPELEIALRFLKTAVEYKETKRDSKVLLQLPKEERDLFVTLLEEVEE